jgi:Protein of unknown function (DUF3301)
MLTVLLLMIVFVPAFTFWSTGREVAQLAVDHGRRACYHAGVQWLDQNVHQVRLRPYRRSDGWLGWERHFRFEYSTAGEDRRAGVVIMQGRMLAGLIGPMPPETATVH